jgi:hypothetical protein
MGMSVDIYVYDIKKLKSTLDDKIKIEENQIKPSEFLERIMSEIGVVHENTFSIQSCDYWDDYDPYMNMTRAFETYYQNASIWQYFDEAQYDWKYNGVEESEIYTYAGIDTDTLKPHPYDEPEEEE